MHTTSKRVELESPGCSGFEEKEIERAANPEQARDILAGFV